MSTRSSSGLGRRIKCDIQATCQTHQKTKKTVSDGQTSKEWHGRANTTNNTMITPRPQTLCLTPISSPQLLPLSGCLVPVNILGLHQHQNDNLNTMMVTSHTHRLSLLTTLNTSQKWTDFYFSMLFSVRITEISVKFGHKWNFTENNNLDSVRLIVTEVLLLFNFI